jgi:hypothetical protein
MEQTVLRQLDFRLTAPTSFDFIAPFLRAATGAAVLRGDRLYMLTNMLAELTLPEYSFWNYLPSQVAAAAVCLAHFTMGKDLPDRAGFEAFTKYSLQDLQHTISELWELHKRAPSADYRAVLTKYAKPDKYQAISCEFAHAPSLAPFFAPSTTTTTSGSHFHFQYQYQFQQQQQQQYQSRAPATTAHRLRRP